MIVGTAPSMDGFASATSSVIRDGLKISLATTAPVAFLADTSIMKEAPARLLQAGHRPIRDAHGLHTGIKDAKGFLAPQLGYIFPQVIDGAGAEIDRAILIVLEHESGSFQIF